jgi:hypothetical protein
MITWQVVELSMNEPYAEKEEEKEEEQEELMEVGKMVNIC